jgi:tetratricopeptide (TPR) repeat protein
MKLLLPLSILLIFAFPPNTTAQRNSSAKKLLKKGNELFAKGDIAGAIAEYNEALIADPRLASAYLDRGNARRAAGDLDGAIMDYESAEELESRLVRDNRDIAQAYLTRGYQRSNRLELDGALADLDRAINLNPQDAEAYFKRGRAWLIDGRIDLAIAERGFARQARGDKTAAEEDFAQGLKLNNDLRITIDLHLFELQLQIKEMRKRQAAIQRNIARISGYIRRDDGSRCLFPAA